MNYKIFRDKKVVIGFISAMVLAIAAVAVFFVATLVMILMGLFASTKDEGKIEGTTDWKECWTKV